jgi:hypothetical protein
VKLGYPFPRIEGLFPQLSHYLRGPLPQLKAYFILSPEYLVPKVLKGSCYCTEGLIDYNDYQEIYDISRGHIRKTKRTEGTKLYCHYNSWVRLPKIIYLFYFIFKILAKLGFGDEGTALGSYLRGLGFVCRSSSSGER